MTRSWRHRQLLAKTGSTPWSGQRAALRDFWPDDIPEDFTADLSILLHWSDARIRLRPVLADDWVNPQRPKPDLIFQEFALLTNYAVRHKRLPAEQRAELERWFEVVHTLMSEYRPGEDDPQRFEESLLERSLNQLNRFLKGGIAPIRKRSP
ncbi:hypothetical protein [Sphaerisporangium sp. TRM90804]|uniref:hypothetical protein n=1 Tax=Sphaerisporangium sp. TRM90804 TaxID=3031113 RepID=UPI002446FF64|nr:hypothetical protein [Sphaerisporangium sp. TRM90804]MDH2428602.1 hypothetical protein [Sphaerisporangium sp. TRM90804]